MASGVAGPVPGPCNGGVVTHAATGAREALCSRAKGSPAVPGHTRRGDRYGTVIIDLTPVRDRSGPARLLDVAPGRSRKVLKTWLSAWDESWRGRVEAVAPGWFHRVQERRR